MAENKQIEEMALAICKSRGVTNGEGCEWCGQDSLCLYQQIAMSLYGAGYRKQEWISVKDALPEDEQTVLTIDTEREMQVCFYETAQKGVFQLFHGLVSVYNITHWMPLPQSPKGE